MQLRNYLLLLLVLFPLICFGSGGVSAEIVIGFIGIIAFSLAVNIWAIFAGIYFSGKRSKYIFVLACFIDIIWLILLLDDLYYCVVLYRKYQIPSAYTQNDIERYPVTELISDVRGTTIVVVICIALLWFNLFRLYKFGRKKRPC